MKLSKPGGKSGPDREDDEIELDLGFRRGSNLFCMGMGIGDGGGPCFWMSAFLIGEGSGEKADSFEGKEFKVFCLVG